MNPESTGRWKPPRKEQLLHEIATGALTRAEALEQYGLSADELAEWQKAYDAHGLPGLRSTRSQMYRGHPAPRFTR
jgi:hypothetical protein